MMLNLMPTAFIFIAAAILLLALPKGPLRAALLLLAPVVAALQDDQIAHSSVIGPFGAPRPD